MSKQTPTDHDILEIITQRWSPRAFSDKTVLDDDLKTLFEAARWAPSSSNLQPWRFIVCKKGSAAYDKLLATLADGNKTWASQAPILILGVAETTLIREGKPTRENGHAKYDLGHAVANLSLQAVSMDLYLHQMGGFSTTQAEEAFALPEEFSAVVAIALGYMGDASDLSEALADREAAPRTRMSQGEFVFDGQWGNS